MKVFIIGAGFSGLTLAYFLVKKNVEVEIFEASDRVGGLIETKVTAHGPVETAANGIWNSTLMEAMLEDLKIPLAARKLERKNRFIFRHFPKKWPLSLLESLRFVSGFAWNWAFRSLKPQANETISEWGVRVGGLAFARYLLAPALQGIYAGDADRMSAELILSRFFAKSNKVNPKQKGTIAPEKGMGQLIAGLQDWLSLQGVKIHCQQMPPTSARPLIIATPAWQAAQILTPIAPKAANLLEAVEALPLISATLFFEHAPNKARGFGCLFPKDQLFHSLGVLFNTDIFEGRGEGRSETWILGGALHGELMNKSDDEILSLILKDRARLFSQTIKPRHFSLTRWPKALPHYTVEWKQQLSNLTLPRGIYLTGNYLGSIGLSRILEYNFKIASTIAEGA